MNVINTKHQPSGLVEYVSAGMNSRAYYNLNPYPYYAFKAWNTEKMGPYPTCLSIGQQIIDRPAKWLFGKPPEMQFREDQKVNEYLLKIWKQNNMDSKLVSIAEQGGRDGGVVIKFTYDASKAKQIKLQVLSPLTQVRFYYDPHDIDTLLMARIQYEYFDPETGKFMWYREEWTETEEIRYKPQESQMFGAGAKIDYMPGTIPIWESLDKKEWEIDKQIKNNFGIIPVVHIKNRETFSHYGKGDIFGLTHLLDRINLSYHLMDRSNQLEVDPTVIFIDLEPKDDDSMDHPGTPGTTLDMKTADSDEAPTKQGRAEILESGNKIREHIASYASNMKSMLFDSTGAVFPRQEDITNKGSLTQSVLIQMYQPLLEVVGQKKIQYGENGISLLMKTLIIALANIGVVEFRSFATKTISDLEYSLTWYSQFTASADEMFNNFDRIDREVKGGYISPKVAVQRVSQMEEISITEEELIEREKEVKNAIERDNKTSKSREPGGSQDGQSSDGEGNDRKSKSSRQQQRSGGTVGDRT